MKTASSHYDLAVAYRIYPVVAKPAHGLPFSEDKLRLSEICLKSFKESLGNLRVKLWVLLDNCPPGYAELFLKYFAPQDLVLLPLPGAGNRKTFGKQIDILLGQTDSEFVYFAEDDYLYLPGQFARMIEFLRDNDDVHFITPYDHPDCYRLEIHREPKWLRVGVEHHWRTAASTCLTFLTRKDTLRRTQRIFRSYCRRNGDCALWLSLTKRSIFNPILFARFASQDAKFAKIIAKAWYYGWSQILFGKQRRLWVPVPAVATHLDNAGLSPTVPWRALLREQAKTLGYANCGSAERSEHRAKAAVTS